MSTRNILTYENLHEDPVGGDWRLTYASASRELQKSADFHADWSQLLVPEELHLIFNLSGGAVIMGERIRIGIASSTIAMCCPRCAVTATRLPDGEDHEFVVLSMNLTWLKKTLGHGRESIYPAVWDTIVAGEKKRMEGKPLGNIRSMTLAEKEMARNLTDPPVEEAAQPFWYVAKVTEILALHMFSPTHGVNAEPFCVGQNRMNRERVDAAIEWLSDHIAEPLDLTELAQHIGCAPHYLSRIFSKEMGRTLLQYLRAMRIDRAAELLDSGRYNVTEAAFEVGYNSLSHFSKAFLIEKGVKPSVYKTRK